MSFYFDVFLERQGDVTLLRLRNQRDRLSDSTGLVRFCSGFFEEGQSC